VTVITNNVRLNIAGKRGPDMKRREFIALLASSAAWSRVARAQQPAPVIGLLTAIDMADWAANGVRDGLGEAGYAEGRNLTIVTRSAEGHFDRLPALAADLVNSKVAVILASSSPVPTTASTSGMFFWISVR